MKCSQIFADLPINREIPKKLIHTKIDLAITNLGELTPLRSIYLTRFSVSNSYNKSLESNQQVSKKKSTSHQQSTK